MVKLPDDVRQMIDKLCQRGDQFAQMDQYDDALDQYEAAWQLLPEPKHQWPAATWILMAAGDTFFEKRDFAAAADAFRESLECPDGGANPFILLRLGQSEFEVGDLNAAADGLERVLREFGQDLFDGEDPKYLSFIKTQTEILRTESAPSGRFTKPLRQQP